MMLMFNSVVEIEFQIAKSWDWVVICTHFGPEFSILVTWLRKLFDHVYGPFFLSEKKKKGRQYTF